ncbi:unnamed protein product [Prunus armeniaca]|uniref:Uncharacterized protein n=1 Tax=Prunus armeniaca TaxID=36596 RepID=A0A6J5WVJ6_PRUAR|nr:unnamed protein product [Prunus armeniaca]
MALLKPLRNFGKALEMSLSKKLVPTDIGCSLFVIETRSRSLIWSPGPLGVQLHGVLGFCMTVAVAKAVRASLGEVLWVDNRDGTNCVCRFIRIHVRFDVTLPLIRRTPVTFPEVGERMLDVKYEYLPEYCFMRGKIGHPSQVIHTCGATL